MGLRINLAFKLPKEIAKKAIFLSKKIGKNNDSFFVLNGIDAYPHITVYAPIYQESKIDEVFKNVKQEEINLELNFKGISSSQGFISLNFETSPGIQKFHEKIVKTLNPSREKDISNGSDYNMDFDEKQKESIDKYGYPDAMKLYSPHLTIIRLKDEKLAKNLAKNIKWDINQFVVNEIELYKMGDNGICKKHYNY
ncbi:MAG: 2'-5' RNA ligase family protein [Minisyncoccales bacterium]